MSRTIRFLLPLLLAVSLIAGALLVLRPPTGVTAQTEGLPAITFLGQGPGTFTVESPLLFLVKTYRNNQWLFIGVDGPSFTAGANERVWSIDRMPAETIRLHDEWKSFGTYPGGCTLNYVQIEDNPDSRRNTFYFNGQVMQLVEQGWVTYGSLTMPADGELTFFAEDSVGIVLTGCLNQVEPTATTQPVEPTATTPVSPTDDYPPPAEPSPTDTTAPTATNTTAPTATSTSPSVPGVTPTTGGSPNTAVPTNTVRVNTSVPTIATTPLASLTPDPATRTAQAAAATPVRTPTRRVTPAVIPVTGGGPGTGEIRLIGLSLLGMALALLGGWRVLLKEWRRGR
jgi:hypothetical protein